MGSVFEAEQISMRRLVAIKVLHPAQAKKTVTVKRFHQEARAVGSIGHPNICEVFDMGELPDGSPYIVLERLVGQTLSARAAVNGPLAQPEAVDIFSQVCSGLVAAHERGILHRDIKPENIFLSQRAGCPSIAKLLDFGVSKMLGAAGGRHDFDDETLTKTGMVMGTPYYMAPEQARGDREIDGRLDVYACGVVLYEILTGKRPFAGANYNALLIQILTGTPAPLRSIAPTVSPQMERLVHKAMARPREQRFASAAELRQALLELNARRSGEGRAARGAPTGARPPPLPPAVARPVAISFVDTGEIVSDDDAGPTTTRRAPAPVSPSKYADSAADSTQLLSREQLQRLEAARLAAEDGSVSFDDVTVKMGRDEVNVIATAALAKERERNRKKP